MLNSNTTTALNVVVTAASSPLGRETVRHLVGRGHVVTGLTHGSDGGVAVRSDGGLPAYSDLYRPGEIRSILNMAAADVVVHLAPQLANTFPHSALPWDENNRILADGTTALLAAVADTSTKFVVHTSYAWVYGDTHGEWVDESHEPHPISELNAAVKAEKRFLNHTVPAAVLRGGIVYGPQDEGMLALGEAARHGRSLFLGDPHAYHNWVYVGDMANALVLAVESQPAGQVLNVVDDSPVSAVEFASHLAREMGVTPPRNNATLPDFARRLVNNPIQESLSGVSARVKNDKARQTLAWNPRCADYRAGIDQTLIAWRAALPIS